MNFEHSIVGRDQLLFEASHSLSQRFIRRLLEILQMKNFHRNLLSLSISMIEVVLFCVLPLVVILLPIVLPIATWYYIRRQRRKDRKTDSMRVIPEEWVPRLERSSAHSNSVSPWASEDGLSHDHLHFTRSGPSINLVPPSPPTGGRQTPGSALRTHSGVSISVVDIMENAQWDDADHSCNPEELNERHQAEVLLADGSRLIIPYKLPPRPSATTPEPVQRDNNNDNFSDTSRPTQHNQTPSPHDLLKVPSSDRLMKPINIPDGPIPYKPISQRRRTSYSHG